MTWNFIFRLFTACYIIPVNFNRIDQFEIEYQEFKNFISILPIEKKWNLYMDRKEPKKRCIDIYAVDIVNMINYVAYSNNTLFLYFE